MVDDESGSSAFSLSRGDRIRKVNVGGRDVVVTTTAADAASPQYMSQVLAALKELEEQIAILREAPAGLRDDAQDELRKAHKAGTQGDTQRLVETLGTAQGYLECICQSLPAAVRLAHTVATLAPRVGGMV